MDDFETRDILDSLDILSLEQIRTVKGCYQNFDSTENTTGVKIVRKVSTREVTEQNIGGTDHHDIVNISSN